MNDDKPPPEKEADCIMPYTNNGHFWPLSDDGIYNPGATLVLHCDDGYGVENNFDRVMCVTSEFGYDNACYPLV